MSDMTAPSAAVTSPLHDLALKAAPAIETFNVLGTQIAAVQIGDVVAAMDRWIEARSSGHYLAVTGMHGVTEALSDREFAAALDDADMVVPDGMPLVWLGRRTSRRLERRVYGPELMLAMCEHSVAAGYRHFLYGGKPGVAEVLAEKLAERFPGIQIVGTYVPPFRDLTGEEIGELKGALERAKPDVLWVGLSTPKQEKWMHRFSRTLNVPVMVGVGAAFDFHSGLKRQAPRWMQESGLEWFFRLVSEPRRLWRRYLIRGPRFVFCVMVELAGLKNFQRQR